MSTSVLTKMEVCVRVFPPAELRRHSWPGEMVLRVCKLGVLLGDNRVFSKCSKPPFSTRKDSAHAQADTHVHTHTQTNTPPTVSGLHTHIYNNCTIYIITILTTQLYLMIFRFALLEQTKQQWHNKQSFIYKLNILQKERKYCQCHKSCKDTHDISNKMSTIYNNCDMYV